MKHLRSRGFAMPASPPPDRRGPDRGREGKPPGTPLPRPGRPCRKWRTGPAAGWGRSPLAGRLCGAAFESGARGRRAGRRFAAAAALAGALLALPANAIEPAPPGLAGDGCDPGVAAAMETAAVEGIRRDAAIIRNPVGGIGDPGSLFDFTCLDRLLDGGTLDIHFSVGGLISGILGAIQGRICDAARRIFAGGVGRPIEMALLRSGLPRLPGLDVGYGRGGGGGVRIAPPGHGGVRPDVWGGRRLEDMLRERTR